MVYFISLNGSTNKVRPNSQQSKKALRTQGARVKAGSHRENVHLLAIINRSAETKLMNQYPDRKTNPYAIVLKITFS
jgi:hypothetical protein